MTTVVLGVITWSGDLLAHAPCLLLHRRCADMNTVLKGWREHDLFIHLVRFSLVNKRYGTVVRILYFLTLLTKNAYNTENHDSCIYWIQPVSRPTYNTAVVDNGRPPRPRRGSSEG